MEPINWGFALSSLFIRFIGVFVVLAILQVGIRLSSYLINRFASDQPPAKGAK
jgi:Na+-transporting methylmalonyl-CoA/oxaloacetate decarboxylase gamma subunit